MERKAQALIAKLLILLEEDHLKLNKLEIAKKKRKISKAFAVIEGGKDKQQK